MDVACSNKNYNTNDDAFFEALRNKEYSRVDEGKQVYFDYTGGNLYPQCLLTQHFSFLEKHVLGNPHSTNPTSKLATQKVEEARAKVLSFFNATEDYYCVFTANASGALKIVGECYPFQQNGALILFADNHNSVNGLREFCKNKQGQFEYCPMYYENLQVDDSRLTLLLDKYASCENKLLAFPAQSNVSGVKHDLSWIQKAQNQGWDVMLDAAAYVPTSALDLKKTPANFVSISFYKIFGFPTGIGCLFIRKDTFPKLQKPWFAGGTVAFAAVNEPLFKLINNHERFEDGTINYLEIPAIKNGLEYIESIGINKINERVKNHTQYLLDAFQNLKHSNGQALITVYGPKSSDGRGGNIIFNVLKNDGSPINFTEVEEKANAENISIRTGCFCNPGIDEINNCISNEDLAKFYTAKEGASFAEMIQVLGKMRGAIRISVGFVTNSNDIQNLLLFLESFKS